MLTYAITALGVIALITFMVWGDDGPFWKNFTLQTGVGLVIVVVIVVGTWVSEYGT